MIRGSARKRKVNHLVLVVVIVAGLANDMAVEDDDDADAEGGGAKCSVPDGTTIITSLSSSSVFCRCIPCIGSVISVGCCGSLA